MKSYIISNTDSFILATITDTFEKPSEIYKYLWNVKEDFHIEKPIIIDTAICGGSEEFRFIKVIRPLDNDDTDLYDTNSEKYMGFANMTIGLSDNLLKHLQYVNPRLADMIKEKYK